MEIKLYGTFGPSCYKTETLAQMIRAGMTGIRLNLSHTNLARSKEWIENLKKASEQTKKQIDLAIDLIGPELRIGDMSETLVVQKGDTIWLGADAKKGAIEGKEKNFLSILQCLASKLQVGQEISINDGTIKADVDAVEEEMAICHVKTAGEISSRKSISIKGVDVDSPVLTKQDIENLSEAKKYGVTEVMLPFVRGVEDVEQVRAVLRAMHLEHVKILAKIEHEQGVEHIDDIIGHADCIVIARGDLGNRFPIWKVPGIQKGIAKKCVQKGQKFMVVTQMLHSMIQNPTPTRAEVLDIYNAILDGATSLMVTGETAVGSYPVEVMDYMAKVVEEAKDDNKIDITRQVKK